MSSATEHSLAAQELCAAILNRQRNDGRFAGSVDEVREAMKLVPVDFHFALRQALALDWVRITKGDVIELKASGIYVAKRLLDLPR